MAVFIKPVIPATFSYFWLGNNVIIFEVNLPMENLLPITTKSDPYNDMNEN